MQNFTFHNPTRIIFGEGQIAAIDAHVPRGARVLITSGGGSIKSNGVLAQVQAALGSVPRSYSKVSNPIPPTKP